MLWHHPLFVYHRHCSTLLECQSRCHQCLSGLLDLLQCPSLHHWLTVLLQSDANSKSCRSLLSTVPFKCGLSTPCHLYLYWWTSAIAWPRVDHTDPSSNSMQIIVLRLNAGVQRLSFGSSTTLQAQ